MISHCLPDGSETVEIDGQHKILSVLFTEDGKQVWSGGVEGKFRRWRVDNGHMVGEPIQTGGGEIFAAALSPDGKWLACGLRPLKLNDGKASVRVWDTQSHEKVLDIKDHTNTVCSVDISLDSTKLATGSCDEAAFIWSMITGERLVGPLEHGGSVLAVQFSPNGDRIATATAAENSKDPKTAKSIRIYDSDDGRQLLDIPFRVYSQSLPLAWSADGLQLFAASYGEVTRFDTTSGTVLSKWLVLDDDPFASIILSRNQKFAVVATSDLLSFWDTSTDQQIGTVIQISSLVWAIALSPTDDHIATGEQDGTVTLRSLRSILPDSYLKVDVSDKLGNVVQFNTSWSITVALDVHQRCGIYIMDTG